MEERHDDPKLSAPTLGQHIATVRSTTPGRERETAKAIAADRRRLDIINGRKRGRL